MKVPVSISDELTDNVIQSEGFLDLASGEVTNVKYINYDVKKEGIPALKKDYEFTCAILKKDDKELEFTLSVEDGVYSVSADELEEVKEKSIKLFAGVSTPKRKRI